MIVINLLPKELRARHKEMHFPLQRWIVLGLLLLFVIWLFMVAELQYLRIQLHKTLNYKLSIGSP